MAEPRLDIVLFGATGFTGALTAEYLARNAPADTRWALAGRNREKLEDVRRRIGAEVELLEADVNDADSLRSLAQATKVVITTVGPYLRYGEPLVAACARAGTAYVDLTGEPEFVDRMWLSYHSRAVETGARLVHSCGFDSIPYDLGAQFTVEQLPEGVPIAVEGFVRVGGTFSGGTYQSTIEILSRLRQGAAVARDRRAHEPRPSDRRVKGVAGMPHHDEFAGGWVVPFPTIDPQTVLRSARALERYGPDFTYSHYLAVKRLPVLAGLVGGAAGVAALAQIPPTRKMLLTLKGSGEGPSPEQREKSWFRVRFAARAGGRVVRTEVSGGDPGYSETSKMLAESALCLAFDDLPDRGGQLTPAVAMGDALRRRLVAAGIKFEGLDGGP
ncbi:MAG: saccharopine dehydrogenase NADP-binding domain-containing protein [Solirubrobacterales bacterium]|nr:saccharopine dehydrogenase NADP-binding domain-containing protein [Solirubrobacterales bacterium]